MTNYDASFKNQFMINSTKYFREMAHNSKSNSAIEYLNHVNTCIQFEETLSSCYEDPDTKKTLMDKFH